MKSTLILFLLMVMSSCISDVSTNKTDLEVSSEEARKNGGNQPGKGHSPIVNAGSDIVAKDVDNNGSESISLKGQVFDAQDNIIQYSIIENGITLSTGSSPSIFTQTLNFKIGVHYLTFIAKDAKGYMGQDSLVITVNAGDPVLPPKNTAPVVNAGPDMTYTDSDNDGKFTVKLQGSAVDAENNIVKYRVHKNGATYAGGTVPFIFIQEITLPVGTHTMTFEATDAGGLVGTDTVVFTIKAPVINTAPKVSAGGDITLVSDSTSSSFNVKLSGSATDAENNITQYRVYVDGNLKLSGSSPSVLTPTLPFATGKYTVRMEAQDAGGLVGADELLVTINAAPTPPPTGKAPIANAGPDIMKINTNLNGGVESLTVTGSVTAGSNPIVSYVWKNNGVIVQRSTTPEILTINKINFIKGNNLLTLEVTDSMGLKGIDEAIVEVRPSLQDESFIGRAVIPGVLSISAGGQRIVVDRDQNGEETVRLVGSVNSVNPIVSYKWRWRSQILASGSTPDVLTTKVTMPIGQFNLWLDVQDSKGNTISDVFNLAVTPPVVEQVAKIPSNFNTEDYLVKEWATGPSHWKDNSAFRFRCKASHFLYDDPIVFPGQPGKAHLHMFFGNTMANGNSTYESLRKTGDGSCDGGPLNRSAYWMPAVVNENGKVAVPDHITIYYKRHPGTNRIPRGLRMIFGFDHRYPDQKIKRWKCANGGGEFETIPEVNCPADQQLMVTLGAPNCWDGKNLDSADHRSHMSYGSYNQYGENVCPDTHPVNIPSFTMLISWSHSGFAEYSKWRLASDHVSPHDPTSAKLPPGSTMHSDWFGGWDDGVMDMWHDGCMDQFKSCSGGALGMGKMLKENPGFSFKTIDRIIDPPVKPLP